MEIKWFIESWSVQDGFAFASQREKDDSQRIQTSFISPPYFDPIPINNISTALNAARMRFQEGLWKDNQEVAFDSLEQIVELVRRSYVKGGTGLDGPPAPTDSGSPPPREPEGRDGDGYPVGPENEKFRHEITGLINQLRAAHGSDRRDLTKSLYHYLESGIDYKLFERFAADSNWAIVNQTQSYNYNYGYLSDDDNIKMLEVFNAWICLSCAIFPDLWFIFENDSRIDPELYDYYYRRRYYLENFHFTERLNQDVDTISRLFFCIPINKQWTNDKLFDSVGDYLCAVLGDKELLDSALKDWNAFVPIIFCALLLSAGSTQGGHGLLTGSRNYYKILRRTIKKKAAEWLSQAMPSNILDETQESIVSDLNFKP